MIHALILDHGAMLCQSRRMRTLSKIRPIHCNLLVHRWYQLLDPSVLLVQQL